jgi:hypothetical protein
MHRGRIDRCDRVFDYCGTAKSRHPRELILSARPDFQVPPAHNYIAEKGKPLVKLV